MITNHKSIIIICTLLAVLALLAAITVCGIMKKTESVQETRSDIYDYGNKNGYLIEMYDNHKIANKSFSEMKEMSLSEHEFRHTSCYGIQFSGILVADDLRWYNKFFSPEYLEKIDDNNIVTAVKLSDKGIAPVYAYCPFSKKVRDGFVDDSGNQYEAEQWMATGECYYTNETLSKSTFDSIKVGDNFADLEKLNPIFNIGIYFFSGPIGKEQYFKIIYYIVPEGTVELQIFSDENCNKCESRLESKNFHVEEITFTPFGTPSHNVKGSVTGSLTAIMDHAPLLPSVEAKGDQK